jgi:hypothetical protein
MVKFGLEPISGLHGYTVYVVFRQEQLEPWQDGQPSHVGLRQQVSAIVEHPENSLEQFVVADARTLSFLPRLRGILERGIH